MSRRSLLSATAAAGLAMIVLPGLAEAFTVNFSWAGIPACAGTSPAFVLGGVPPGTRQLRFAMRDLDVPTFHHGGSTVAYRGDAVKKGTIRYVGPCPPRGERHRYRWIVEALDAGGKVLGRTTATQTFPP